MNTARDPLATRLIDALYTEAMLLADEARSYFDRNGRDDRLGLDPVLRVGFSVESLKVTTRLMHVVAWLLAERAAEAERLGNADAGRLGIVPDSDPRAIARLPEGAKQLVRASQDLFARVRRLAESGGSALPRPSPARSLLSRLERAF